LRAKLLSSGQEWLSDVVKTMRFNCSRIESRDSTVKVKFSHNVQGKKMPGTIKGGGGSICEAAAKPEPVDHF